MKLANGAFKNDRPATARSGCIHACQVQHVVHTCFNQLSAYAMPNPPDLGDCRGAQDIIEVLRGQR
ncbi:hypothetical protein, partial [Dysgonomonas mossii]|uniref:hypothetical protein n=1 Tax=Dysgonomonas mossii TaxID=163665 RepID=UPI001D16CF1E